MDMKETPGSSNIVSHGYDKDSKTMAIKFKGGGLYNYAGVEPHEYDAFAAAESLGKHFHANIRSKFQGEKQP